MQWEHLGHIVDELVYRKIEQTEIAQHPLFVTKKALERLHFVFYKLKPEPFLLFAELLFGALRPQEHCQSNSHAVYRPAVHVQHCCLLQTVTKHAGWPILIDDVVADRNG